MTRVIFKGRTGPDVLQWQNFLLGKGFVLQVTGEFDDRTDFVTRRWQKSNGLGVDGEVGRESWKAAIAEGFPVVADDDDTAPNKKPAVGHWPVKPTTLRPYVSNEERMKVFGRFSYRAAPTRSNPEAIEITDGWAETNIIMASVPGLYATGLAKKAQVACHRTFQPAVERFFAEAHKAGMLKRLVLSYDGLWVPRFIRGSRSTLSNHAWGTAFDLNADTNPLGHEPAAWGRTGCLYELVALANECGMWWGGHFTRRDGMHFEKARSV